MSAPAVSLFLCGDVMTGRGVDQILPFPSDPVIHEEYVHSALDYVALAEGINGPIPRPVDAGYVWGEALAELESRRPDVRIINLETSITRSEDWEPKGINYRMSPGNACCLRAARVDCCALANNHVLDWGTAGLSETLRTLDQSGVRSAGAGVDWSRASSPAVLGVRNGGRVLVFSFGFPSSGIPVRWSATSVLPGVFLLDQLSRASIEVVRDRVRDFRRPGDLVVASIHWGGNWGYAISAAQRRFAHSLIDEADVDLIHGHSSHHPIGFEVHSRKLILYGCGDFLNDYEGISGYEEYRPELALMYFPALEAEGGFLSSLEIVPMRIRRFRLEHGSRDDLDWIQALFERESRGVAKPRVLTRSLLWSGPTGEKYR